MKATSSPRHWSEGHFLRIDNILRPLKLVKNYSDATLKSRLKQILEIPTLI